MTRGAIVRCTIDTRVGEAKDATADKETGHSANAPSVLEGFKKLDGMFAPTTKLSAMPKHSRLQLSSMESIANK